MIQRYRAWDPHKKKMVDDTELVIWGGNIYQGNRQKIFERIVEGKKGLIGYSIDDKHLMQSTGLKDKNDTEIFEGDALKNNDYPNQTFICKHSRLQASFQAESLNGLLTLSLWKDEERDWQVIGNIYANPELLEENK